MFGVQIKKTTGEKPRTYWEEKNLKKIEERKKKLNIFLSREDGGGAKSIYKPPETSFAGGRVERHEDSFFAKSRNLNFDRAKLGGAGYGPSSAEVSARQNQLKTGFAGGNAKASFSGKGSSLPPKKSI